MAGQAPSGAMSLRQLRWQLRCSSQEDCHDTLLCQHYFYITIFIVRHLCGSSNHPEYLPRDAYSIPTGRTTCCMTDFWLGRERGSFYAVGLMTANCTILMFLQMHGKDPPSCLSYPFHACFSSTFARVPDYIYGRCPHAQRAHQAVCSLPCTKHTDQCTVYSLYV